MKSPIKIILTSFFSGIAGAFIYSFFFDEPSVVYLENRQPGIQTSDYNYNQVAYSRMATNEDFVAASAKSTHSVVYIKTLNQSDYGRSSFFDWFFEGRGGQSISSGSGVIFSTDGYIITNNHVVSNAEKIEVIHNKRSYEARLVGTDPSTDIAVLKIEATDLPNITLGTSRNLQVGEWVLAVGNPFNLTSTITAGIVSAKARQINILQSRFPIESFIQTDAAINPGNSGGALVNAKGELVGINTAILSQTGSYSGYGFAVPVDIVKKAVEDIIEFGEVQKAFVGADVVDITPEVINELNIKDYSGVVLNYIQKDGAAEKEGLRKGDIILKINNEEINSRSEFEEILSYYSPGDKIRVTYKREGKISDKTLELTNREGTTALLKKEIFRSAALGAEFETVSKVERELLNIKNGVRVVKIKDGFIRRLGIQEGFIITAINKNAIDDPQMLAEILEKISGKVIIEGINNKGVRGYYSFYI